MMKKDYMYIKFFQQDICKKKKNFKTKIFLFILITKILLKRPINYSH